MNGFVNYLCKEFDLTDIEKLKLKYSLDVLLLDVSKIIILFTLFYIIGEARNFLYSVFALFLMCLAILKYNFWPSKVQLPVHLFLLN